MVTTELPETVVTGVSGFLGSELCRMLVASGQRVLGVSRQPGPDRVTVADYVDCPASEVIVHAAEQPDRGIVNRSGRDYANHAAAVIEALLRRTQHLVYVSSGVVYGDQGEQPFEETAAVHATDAYAESKLRNEALVLSGNGTVLRLANLYGQRMAPSNVLSDIRRQVPGNAALLLRDVSPVRDFLGVGDAAHAVQRTIQRNFRGVLNIGSGVGLSVCAVAELALRVLGQPGRPVQSSQPSSRRSYNVLDIRRAREALDWSPTAPVEGLERFFLHGAVH